MKFLFIVRRHFIYCRYNFSFINCNIQGVLLPDQEKLRVDSRHEDKHHKIGNHGAQTSSVGDRGHESLGSKTSNADKKLKKRSIRLRFSLK